MLLTAATAVALVPYQVQRQAEAALSPGAAVMTSAPATALGMVYGVAAGGFLFVAAALAFWRRQGCAFRLEPGHWLAIQGAGQWVFWIATWLAILWGEQHRYGVVQLVMVPRFLLGLAFFVIYLRLVARSGESLPWRWTYFALATLPAAAAGFSTIVLILGWSRGQVAAQMLPQGAAAATIGLLLLTALLGDLRDRTPRHWTHWLGATARSAVVLFSAAMYLYYGLYPAALGR